MTTTIRETIEFSGSWYENADDANPNSLTVFYDEEIDMVYFVNQHRMQEINLTWEEWVELVDFINKQVSTEIETEG